MVLSPVLSLIENGLSLELSQAAQEALISAVNDGRRLKVSLTFDLYRDGVIMANDMPLTSETMIWDFTPMPYLRYGMERVKGQDT